MVGFLDLLIVACLVVLLVGDLCARLVKGGIGRLFKVNPLDLVGLLVVAKENDEFRVLLTE